MKETDLYIPIKNLFENMGYSVTSEVNNIDIIAINENSISIIELKTSLNLKLLIQATQRQKISSNVYIAIPKPTSKKRFARDVKDKEHLIRRLELGLIYVTLNSKQPYATIIFEPKQHNRRIKNKKKLSIIKEITERHGDNNIGGTNGKIITAYREKSLFIALLLNQFGEMTTKQIRAEGGDEKATSILYQNYYGWFERVKRGTYIITQKGKEALIEYKDIVNKL